MPSQLRIKVTTLSWIQIGLELTLHTSLCSFYKEHLRWAVRSCKAEGNVSLRKTSVKVCVVSHILTSPNLTFPYQASTSSYNMPGYKHPSDTNIVRKQVTVQPQTRLSVLITLKQDTERESKFRWASSSGRDFPQPSHW